MIKEVLHNKRIATALVAVTGALALAGCNGETHGVAGLNLIDCQSGPKTNELVIDTFPKGQSFGLGEDIKTGNAGTTAFGNKYSVHAPLDIISLGNGAFTYSTDYGHTTENATAPPIPNPDGTYSLKLVNEDQEYDLTGRPNQDGSTHLVIDASCTS